MGWIERMQFEVYKKPAVLPATDFPLEKLYSFLEQAQPPYREHAMEVTVRDVLALDDDLKGYVAQFLEEGTADGKRFQTDYGSLEELLETGQFNPVTGALWLQWYRSDPIHATSGLIHFDRFIPNLHGEDAVHADDS